MVQGFSACDFCPLGAHWRALPVTWGCVRLPAWTVLHRPLAGLRIETRPPVTLQPHSLESQTPAFSSSVDGQWEGLRLEGEPAQLRLTPTHLEWMFPGGRPGWHSLPLCEIIGVRPVPEAARVPKATWWGGQAAPCAPTAHIHTFRRAPGRPWEWHPRVIPVSHFDDSRALDAWCHSLQQGDEESRRR